MVLEWGSMLYCCWSAGRVRGVYLCYVVGAGQSWWYGSAQYRSVTCRGAPRKFGAVGKVPTVLGVLRRSGTQQLQSMLLEYHGLQSLA